MTQPAPETIRTPKTRIACDGTGDGLADAALGHPRIWLEIDTDEGFVDCGYCDRRFVLIRSEEHTSALQSLMRISYAVFCLKQTQTNQNIHNQSYTLYGPK